MRLSIANTIQSRDGTLDKDAKLVNCYVEQLGDEAIVYKRPGLSLIYDLGTTGQGQGIICWQGTFYAAKDNTLHQGPSEIPFPDGSLWVDIADLPNHVGGDGFQLWYDQSIDTLYFVSGDDTKTQTGTNDWVTITTNNGLPIRSGMTIVKFLGFLWAFGGSNGIVADNDIYRSTDGTGSLFSLQGNASWPRRSRANCYIFGSSLYMYGGIDDTNGVNTFYSDLWKTNDGINWTEVSSPGLPTSTAQTHIAQVGTRTIVMVGGSTYSSEDGESFSLASASTGFTLTGRMLVSHRGKLYAVSTSGAVWRGDGAGANWQLATASPPMTLDYWMKSDGTDLYSYEYISSTKDNIWKSTNNTISDATYPLTGSANLPLSFTFTSGAASTEYLVLKTTSIAWVLTFGQPGTLTQITDVDFPATTVPGVVYLDGFFFVMSTAGEIYNSAIEDPTSWGALDFISAEVEPDNAIALAKHQNYVVALKDTTTELFFDAATASGSPLARLSNAALQVGCANGYSVASLDGALFFMSKTKSNERSVHYFPVDEITPIEVGSAAIRRILTNADITTVHCFAARLDGHSFYVVNLVTEGITLAYSLTSQTWAQWTFQTVTASKSISSLTQSGGVATATSTTHGFSDGDSITVSGATPSGYNGTFNVNVTNANTFTYVVSDSLATPATGTITATGWTEGYFPFGFFATCGGVDFVQHETNGKIYEISKAYSDDEGAVIDVFVRTGRFDGGNSNRKSLHSINVVSDNIDGDLLVRRSDDDYVTFSKYKRIDLSQKKKQSRRFGEFYQRSMDFRYTGSGRLRITAVDIDLDQAR